MRNNTNERAHPWMHIALRTNGDFLFLEHLFEAHVLRRHHVVERCVRFTDGSHVVKDRIAVEEDHLLPHTRAHDMWTIHASLLIHHDGLGWRRRSFVRLETALDPNECILQLSPC